MARGELPWKAVAVGWAVLTAALIAMLGVLLCYVFATPLPPVRTVSTAPATTNPSYVLQGSFVGGNVSGLIRFDNSSEAHALTRQVTATQPPAPPPPATSPPFINFVWGLIRYDNFTFIPAAGQGMFVCNKANLTATEVMQPPQSGPPTPGATICASLPTVLLGQPSSTSNQPTSMGSFNVAMTSAFPAMNVVEVVMLQQQQQQQPGNAVSFFVLSRSLLCSCNVSITVATSSQQQQQQSFGEAFGTYADYTQFVLLVAILLALECAVTLCLTWERRHHQFMSILLCFLMMLQDAMIIVYSSRTVINMDTKVEVVCLALGPVFHLFVTSCLAWYAAATFNVFVIFFNNGQFGRLAFSKSRRNAVWYHIVCWSFVAINFCIVWGLYAVTSSDGRHSLSYGPVPPYAFCWITDSRVLIGAFFAPALAVLAFSLIVTVVVSVQVCSVRCYHKRVNGQTVSEVLSIFLTCSGGLIALVVLGSLMVIYADDPKPYMLLVAALLFLLQAAALWVVVFPRKHTMMLWALVLTCNARQLQRKGTSLKDVMSSNLFSRTNSTPLSSPAGSPVVSGASSSGQLEL